MPLTSLMVFATIRTQLQRARNARTSVLQFRCFAAQDPHSLSGIVVHPGKGMGYALFSADGRNIPKDNSKRFVLVAKQITEDLYPLLPLVEAVIGDGDVTNTNVENVIKKSQVPCVLSTKYASLRINPDDQVSVDADHNQIIWKHDPSQCVFCGKSPTSYVLKTKSFFAIYDGYPAREGHLLVIPSRMSRGLSSYRKPTMWICTI
jgi:phosphohistidine swiveling domain-containing protein